LSLLPFRYHYNGWNVPLEWPGAQLEFNCVFHGNINQHGCQNGGQNSDNQQRAGLGRILFLGHHRRDNTAWQHQDYCQQPKPYSDFLPRRVVNGRNRFLLFYRGNFGRHRLRWLRLNRGSGFILNRLTLWLDRNCGLGLNRGIFRLNRKNVPGLNRRLYRRINSFLYGRCNLRRRRRLNRRADSSPQPVRHTAAGAGGLALGWLICAES
jgi:hypothetical protein